MLSWQIFQEIGYVYLVRPLIEVTVVIYVDIDNFMRIFSRSIYGTEVAHFYPDPF